MNQKTKLSYLSVIVLSLVFGAVSLVAVAKNDNAKAQSQGKTKTTNLKNFEQADKTKGTTNAQLHKVKSEEVTKTLKEEATKQKS